MVIDEPGFKIIEAHVGGWVAGINDISRVTGVPFDDGCLKGNIDGARMILFKIQEIRAQIKKMKEEQ
jgi:hypothetical protein